MDENTNNNYLESKPDAKEENNVDENTENNCLESKSDVKEENSIIENTENNCCEARVDVKQENSINENTENNCCEARIDVKQERKEEPDENRGLTEEEKQRWQATTYEVDSHLVSKRNDEDINVQVVQEERENKDVKVSQREYPMKLQPSTSQLVVEDKTLLPTFRFMNLRWKIGICPTNYPRVRLGDKQMLKIKENIQKRILTEEGFRIKPRFFGVKPVSGCLVLVCGDLSTVSWVKSLPQKLGSLVGVSLKTIDRPPEEKTFVAVGRFLHSESDSNETIKRYLEAQNDGMPVFKWKVMDRNPEKKAVRLTFAVDPISAELLKKKGPYLNFKFGTAKFQLRYKRGTKFMEEDSDYDEDEEEMYWRERKKPKLEPEQDFSCNPLEEDDDYYNQRVVTDVKKAKNCLKLGMTARQRYQRKKRKSKKGKNPNANPAGQPFGLGFVSFEN